MSDRETVMSDKPRTTPSSISESGIMPRPVTEPDRRREGPHRPQWADQRDKEKGTTGTVPVVTEGEDKSAERDEDDAGGN